jgi:hypothetical protein
MPPDDFHHFIECHLTKGDLYFSVCQHLISLIGGKKDLVSAKNWNGNWGGNRNCNFLFLTRGLLSICKESLQLLGNKIPDISILASGIDTLSKFKSWRELSLFQTEFHFSHILFSIFGPCQKNVEGIDFGSNLIENREAIFSMTNLVKKFCHILFGRLSNFNSLTIFCNLQKYLLWEWRSGQACCLWKFWIYLTWVSTMTPLGLGTCFNF